MNNKGIMILFIISTIHSSNSFNIILNNQTEDLVTASAIIVNKLYLPILSHITIVHSISKENSQKFSDTFTSFITIVKTNLTYQIENVISLKQIFDKRRSNLIFIDSLESFKTVCEHLNQNYFKLRKLFTVISINILKETEMEGIFDCFMKRLVIDTNIITYDENKTVNLFTFFPYRNENECSNIKPIKINSFNSSIEQWNNDKFYIRRSNDLKKCLLHIGSAAVAAEPAVILKNNSKGALQVAGIEKDIFIELAHRLNFTPNFVIYLESVGSIFSNGTGKGVLGKVLEGKVDAAIGFVTLQYERAMFLSETTAYAMHPLALIIPNGEEYGDMEKLLRPFTAIVWRILLIILLFSSFFALIFLKFPKIYNFVFGRGVNHPLSIIIAIHLGVPQPRLPKRNFARFILLNFLAYCLVVRSSYQGAVFNILMSNDRKPPVASINEIMDKRYTFYIYESLSSRVQGLLIAYKNHKIFPNADIDKYRRKTLEQNFRGVVFNYENQIHYLNQLNYKKFTYTICKEHFLVPSFVFYFRKNHFLIGEVNSYIERMLANGLIEFISSKYADKDYLKMKPDEAPKVLQIKHIYGAIELYFLCNCVSVVIFIMELATKLKHSLRFPKIRAKRRSRISIVKLEHAR